MIDICDFAVGLSRQLHGLTMHSERPGQKNVRTISSTRNCRNYFCIQFSSGGLVLEHSVSLDLWRCLRLETFRKTPLCGIACQNIITEVLQENNLPLGISNLVIGDSEIGDLMAKDTRVPLFRQQVLPEWGKL